MVGVHRKDNLTLVMNVCCRFELTTCWRLQFRSGSMISNSRKEKRFWWWRHSWLQQSTWLMEKKSESLSHSCQACKNLFECASQFCCIWESSQQSFSNHLCQESNWSLDSKMAGKLLHASENWNCYANKMNMHKIVDGVDSEDEIDEWTKWWKMRHVTWEIYKSGTI